MSDKQWEMDSEMLNQLHNTARIMEQHDNSKAWEINFDLFSTSRDTKSNIGIPVRAVRTGQSESLGFLQVNIVPPEAVSAGVQWSPNSGIS